MSPGHPSGEAAASMSLEFREVAKRTRQSLIDFKALRLEEVNNREVVRKMQFLKLSSTEKLKNEAIAKNKGEEQPLVSRPLVMQLSLDHTELGVQLIQCL